MIEAGKPSSASSMAGASTSARGRAAVALVQGQPAVDGARHLHAADVAPQRHGGVMPSARIRGRIGPEPARPTPSSASGADPGAQTMASMSPPSPHRCGPDDRHGGAGGDGGVGARAALGQDGDPGGHGQLVGRCHHAAHTRARRAKGARGSVTSEDDDGAQHLAALHAAEGALDAVDADRLGHEAIQVEAAVEVEVDEHREVP